MSLKTGEYDRINFKELVINADVQKWFDGPHQISIVSNASVMSPGGVALKIADNYASMFSVNKVVNL